MRTAFLCVLPKVDFFNLHSFLLFVIVCLAGSQWCSATVNDNTLIACWTFDEGQGSHIYDSSGYNNTGDIKGAAWTTNSVSGKALSFDGVNDYVEVPNRQSQQITTNQMSISLWFNLRANIGNTQGRLITKQDSNNFANGWGLEFFGKDYWGSAGNQLVFHDSNGASSKVLLSGKLIAPGAWHHVGVTDNAGQVKIYLDGGLAYSSPNGYGVPSNVPAPIMIGRTCYNPYDTFYFNGLMDEIRLYNRALTGEEMNLLASIPEPATLLLLAIGGMSFLRRRQ